VENNGFLHGGVAILVKNSTPHQQLHINTGLQAIAFRATCHKTITIYSVYFPPLQHTLSLNWRPLSVNTLLLFCFWEISMPTVSSGGPTNEALEERWWRTSFSNLTSLTLIVAYLPTFTLLLHPLQLLISV